MSLSPCGNHLFAGEPTDKRVDIDQIWTSNRHPKRTPEVCERMDWRRHDLDDEQGFGATISTMYAVRLVSTALPMVEPITQHTLGGSYRHRDTCAATSNEQAPSRRMDPSGEQREVLAGHIEHGICTRGRHRMSFPGLARTRVRKLLVCSGLAGHRGGKPADFIFHGEGDRRSESRLVMILPHGAANGQAVFH
jgi:hypothetical protein